MKNSLLNLFKENRILFYERAARVKAPEAAPAAGPQVSAKARLDKPRQQVASGAVAARRDVMPDYYVQKGKENWGILQTEEQTGIEQWAEDLRDKCKDLGELASIVLKESDKHTPGFVAKAQEALSKVKKISDELSGDARSWSALGSYHSVGQMNEHQAEMDEFDATLKGESKSGAGERAENTALLDAGKASDEGIPILDTQVISDANALKALQPAELGEKFATDFYGYYRKSCSPLVNKAKESLGNAMAAGTNVEINRYIAEAQANIAEADRLAGIYITNIDEYHATLKETLEDAQYDGKFGKIAKAELVKESVKVFEKGDKTKEGSLKPEGEALLDKHEPRFELALKGEALEKEFPLTGPKGKMVTGLFEKGMEEILKDKHTAPEEVDRNGEKFIKEFKAKLEIAKAVDELSAKPQYSGKEAKDVLKKFEAEVDPTLQASCDDPAGLQAKTKETFKAYEKDLQVAYLADQMNNKYRVEEVTKALPQLNNPTIDPKSLTGLILNDIRKNPKALEEAKKYLTMIKAPEAKPENPSNGPRPAPKRRQAVASKPVEAKDDEPVSPDMIKVGEGKFAAKAGHDQRGTPVFAGADGKIYAIDGKEYTPAGTVDTKAAVEKAKAYKEPKAEVKQEPEKKPDGPARKMPADPAPESKE